MIYIHRTDGSVRIQEETLGYSVYPETYLLHMTTVPMHEQFPANIAVGPTELVGWCDD